MVVLILVPVHVSRPHQTGSQPASRLQIDCNQSVDDVRRADHPHLPVERPCLLLAQVLANQEHVAEQERVHVHLEKNRRIGKGVYKNGYLFDIIGTVHRSNE